MKVIAVSAIEKDSIFFKKVCKSYFDISGINKEKKVAFLNFENMMDKYNESVRTFLSIFEETDDFYKKIENALQGSIFNNKINYDGLRNILSLANDLKIDILVIYNITSTIYLDKLKAYAQELDYLRFSSGCKFFDIKIVPTENFYSDDQEFSDLMKKYTHSYVFLNEGESTFSKIIIEFLMRFIDTGEKK